MTREDTFLRAIGWKPESRKMHNFPLDKVFGSWFVCTPENCSFVHIRRVMSTCQHVKRCFAWRDGSYVLGADVLLISWRVRRSRVARSNMSQILVCKGTWTLSPPSPQPQPHPTHDQGAVLVCAREHEHPPRPTHPNPNPHWLGVCGCMLAACVNESCLACADACSWRVQMGRLP